MNTDDKDPRTVFLGILACARAWVGEARIIGNIRAMDITRVVEDHIINQAEFYNDIEPDSEGKFGVYFSRNGEVRKLNSYENENIAQYEAEYLSYLNGVGDKPEPLSLPTQAPTQSLQG